MRLKNYLIAFFLASGCAYAVAANPPSSPAQDLATLESARAESRINAEKTGEIIAATAEKRLKKQIENLPSQKMGNEKENALVKNPAGFENGTVAAPYVTRKAPGKVKTGTIFAREYNMNSEKNNSHRQVLALVKEGEYTMSDIFGLKDTKITLSIDAQAGTVTIKPQKVYTHTTYGDLWICPVDLKKPSYSSVDPIQGSIDADGIIRLPEWGLFSIAGEHAGLNFGVITETKWMPANATINITAPNEADNKLYEAAVEQINDNEINVFNIVGNGNYVAIRLYPDKSVKMSPQWVFRHALLGDVCVYKADFEANKINRNDPVEGKATANSITLGSWVAALSTGSSISTQAKSTLISITGLELKFPTLTSFKLEGDGSESNPYKVKDSNDLRAMSQAVAGGNSFAGSHFEMTGDIDMSSLTYSYEPIGENGNPFKGIFDGKGHTIRNLNADGRGFPEMGIFGYVDNGGIIRNVNLDAVTLRHSGATLGALVAVTYGSTSNCNVNARIISTGEVAGGIVGQSVGKIENCNFKGSVSGTGCIAGIAGLCYSTITDCTTEANIELTGVHSQMYHQAAGIAGQILTPSGMAPSGIYNCHSAGSVSDTYGFSPVGGIVCLSANANIERCFNTASINAVLKDTKYDTNTGGVAGWSQGSVIKNCFNAGTIIKTLGQGVKASEMVGGIVGYLSVSYLIGGGKTTIKNVSDISCCYNSGQIISPSKSGHKGVFGDTYYYDGFDPVALSIKDCWSDNQINGTDDGQYGRPTSFFTGNLPDKLSKEIWTSRQGFYPILSFAAGSENGELAAAAVTLDPGEKTDKVKKSVKLSAGKDVEWKFYDNDRYVNETASMKITAAEAQIKNQYGTNMLMARTPKGFFKAVRIKAVPKAFEGEGTKESPYLIRTTADMKRLDEAVGKFGQPHEGDFFAMTGDLDFKGSDFNGVGNAVNEFGGDFDGRNHSIHNLTLKPDGQEWYVGLFHIASEKSAIRNLHIASDCSINTFHYGGAIAGCSEGIVENCSNEAPVHNPGNFGAGIVGLLGQNGEARNCYNSGTITSDEPGAAGIVGMNIGRITLCQNDGDVRSKGTGEAGGIASTHAGEIDRCVNNATITGTSLTGGIAGSVNLTYEKGFISNSINNGLAEITGSSANCGAAIGYIAGSTRFTNNYYDASVNIGGSISGHGDPGFTALTTRRLLDGKQLDGLSAEDFSFESGKYPVLRQFAEKNASRILRSVFMKFAEGESRANLTADAELSASEGVKWTVKKGKNFSINGNTLKVTVPEGMKVENDTVVATVADLWTKHYPVRTMPDVLDGKGSIDNPYQIRTAEDLYRLAVFMDSTAMEYSGYNFRLINDINVAGKDFKPIGMSERSQGHVKFNGTLDGNKKTISGINYVNTNFKSGKYFGFVCVLGEAGTIRDLTLEGSMEAHTGCGGFVGRLFGTIDNCVNRIKTKATVGSGYQAGFAASALNGSVISNSVNEADIEVDKSFAAGFVSAASSGSRIENCVNKGRIVTKSTSGAGIAAESSAYITGCRNEAPVKARTIVGGIIARVSGKNPVTIKGCENRGDIEATELDIAGGICGQVPLVSLFEVNDSHNYGNVKALGKTGGIIGEAKSGSTLRGCSNHGSIYSTGYTGSWVGSAGGLCGQLCGSDTYPSAAIESYNAGEVRSHEAYTGGIAGRLSTATATDCYNLGKIISEKRADQSGAKKVWETGGISGYNTGEIVRCWNAGEIVSNGYAVGGISGLVSADLTDCFNTGKITVTSGHDHPDWGGIAGGVIGYVPLKATIRNCFNLGEVTAPDYAGGIASALSDEVTIENCYNAGNVTGTDTGASHIYNISGFGYSGKRPSCSHLYYLAGLNPQAGGKTAVDAEAKGLDSRNLSSAPMGEAYKYARGCMPTLESTKEKTYGNHAAVGVDYLGNDNAANVTGAVYLGQLDGIVWSYSGNAEIKDNFIYPKSKGELLLKASSTDGKLEKIYKLNVTDMLGVDLTEDDAQIAACEYYDLQGRRIPVPEKGKTNIVLQRYRSGKTVVSKIKF